MARTRAQDMKAQPRLPREQRLADAQAAMLAKAQHEEDYAALEADEEEDVMVDGFDGWIVVYKGVTYYIPRVDKVGEAFPCPWEACGKPFSRSADYRRHYKSKHLHIKEYICTKCGKEYAQRTSLDTHTLNAHPKPGERGGGRYRCKFSSCHKAFSDPSSAARHKNEQHKAVTYQCSIPTCLNEKGERRCIKRRSEFKKHLERHGIQPVEHYTNDKGERVHPLKAYEVPCTLEGHTPRPKKSKQSKKRGPRGRPAGPQAGPSIVVEEYPAVPPPYSPKPYAGEIPLVFTPDGYGSASTPGLSFSSPSPSPSISEAVRYDQDFGSLPPQPSFTSVEGCGDNNDLVYGFPTHGDMTGFSVDAAAGPSLMLSDSYLHEIAAYNATVSYDPHFFDNIPPMGTQTTQSPRDTVHDPFSHRPLPDLPQLFPAPEVAGYGQFDPLFQPRQMSAPQQSSCSLNELQMPAVLDHSYVGQSSAMTGAPTFPQFDWPPNVYCPAAQ